MRDILLNNVRVSGIGSVTLYMIIHFVAAPSISHNPFSHVLSILTALEFPCHRSFTGASPSFVPVP
jgi:hypothetical protein